VKVWAAAARQNKVPATRAGARPARPMQSASSKKAPAAIPRIINSSTGIAI